MRSPYDLVVPEQKVQLQLLCKNLARTVREYFKDSEHRKAFEEWYKAKYGREYVWKTVKRS